MRVVEELPAELKVAGQYSLGEGKGFAVEVVLGWCWIRIRSAASWSSTAGSAIDWLESVVCAAAARWARTRSRISAVALLVKVMASTCSGCSTEGSASSLSKRRISSPVLPEPAGASTMKERRVSRAWRRASASGGAARREGKWRTSAMVGLQGLGIGGAGEGICFGIVVQ